MTDQHPITPPPELVEQWRQETCPFFHLGGINDLAIKAAQCGADQELEACIKLLSDLGGDGEMIRRYRRPKTPSLQEQALVAFDFIGKCHALAGPDWATIRRALEALPE